MYPKKQDTSWETVSDWYDKIVGDAGHDYHKNLIFPYLLDLLKTKKTDRSLLDLGCGQGAFANLLFENYEYTGLDAAESFIKLASQNCKNKAAKFKLQDICENFELGKKFTHALMILSFQNIAEPKEALKNIHAHLKQGGSLILILNHPCFRIPRQSAWVEDKDKKIQSRKIDAYMTPMQIPIQMSPGKDEKATTYSYHHSLTDIFSMLKEAGFIVTDLTELCSHKKSVGKHAKKEDFARKQFPLFMSIVAKSL